MAPELTDDELLNAASALINKPFYALAEFELAEVSGSAIRLPNLDFLIALFRRVWRDILIDSAPIFANAASDPRDAITDAFAVVYRTFVKTHSVLGTAIILECHRYEREKISACWAIEEFQSFLRVMTEYLANLVKGGMIAPVNPSALIEQLFSVLDGMMFIQIARQEFNYSADFSSEDFSTVCRMMMASLLVPSAEQSATYYDVVAEEYDAIYTDPLSLSENSIVGDWLAEVVKGTTGSTNSSILDLGCGSGLGYELLHRRIEGTPFQYFGIDISSGMIRQAKLKHLGQPDARFAVMDMTDLSFFKNNSFDVVCSLFGSFSHALSTERALSEVNRVLRPGGRFFLMVYSRFSMGNFWGALRRLSPSLLAEVRAYEIRKTTGNVFADARFYWKNNIERLFSQFFDVRVQGLNGKFELPFFGRQLKRGNGTPETLAAAKRALARESAQLSNRPWLCHSLIIQGRKNG